jgi:quinol-cytochrome oxidoreductase complex cytochrome b subunit
MVYYKPSTDLAYQSIKDIHFTVSTGRFIRNIHRWSAQLMVLVVLLHMARVFFTASYKKPREFNWLVGLALLVITLALSFTGYLLPWDQLAIWAITVGSNMARATPFLGYEGPGHQLLSVGGIDMITSGSDARFALLGARFVGEETLNRFYVLHCIAIPLAAAFLLAIHFWRVRKDGGISGPL